MRWTDLSGARGGNKTNGMIPLTTPYIEAMYALGLEEAEMDVK